MYWVLTSGSILHLVIIWGRVSMSSYQQHIAGLVDLIAELRELELLRERVKTAELLLGTSR